MSGGSPPLYSLVEPGDLLWQVGNIAPVYLTAYGPTHLDRECVDLPFRALCATSSLGEQHG